MIESIALLFACGLQIPKWAKPKKIHIFSVWDIERLSNQLYTAVMINEWEKEIDFFNYSPEKTSHLMTM